MDSDRSRDALQRMSVPEAASRLGVTQSAIRKRVQRQQILFDKDERGHTYVYLSPSELRDSGSETSPVTNQNVTGQEPVESRDEALVNALKSQIDALRSQVEFLQDELEARREESRRKDSIIAGFVQRVPELEPASDAPESSVTASEEVGKGQVPPEHEKAESESWWRRIFK